MNKKLLMLLIFSIFLVTASLAVANPTKYGASVYQDVSDRISFNDINHDGIDDNGKKSVHSTTKDGISGLGQDNKV